MKTSTVLWRAIKHEVAFQIAEEAYRMRDHRLAIVDHGTGQALLIDNHPEPTGKHIFNNFMNRGEHNGR